MNDSPQPQRGDIMLALWLPNPKNPEGVILCWRHDCNYMAYWSKIMAKIKGTTMVASDSMMNLGVFMPSLPQVIFSLGTAPEYDP